MRSITFLCAVLLASPLLATAQDKIYKTDGAIINAKVKTVGTNTVTYKKYDNPTGPDYTILKKEISSITYETGGQDNFKAPGDADAKIGHSRVAYGKNILSFTPLAYSASLDGSINDAGIGITYERQLDKFGHISFNLPVMMNFSSSKDFNNYDYNYTGGVQVTYPSYHSFFIMPGLKFYPAGSKEMVRYSLGAALFAGFGSEPYAVYEYNNYSATSSYNPTGDYRYAMYGLMISNSINISVSRHVYMALDLSAGIPISDNRHANSDQIDQLATPFIQFAFKGGYRF